MQISNKMTWRRDSDGLPLPYRQGRSRNMYARSLAILFVGLGLFAHVLSHAVVEAAVPAWCATGGHEAYDGHLQWNQKLPEKHILGGSLVCPHEDGVSKTTCMACGICWRDAKFRTAKIGKLLEKHQQ